MSRTIPALIVAVAAFTPAAMAAPSPAAAPMAVIQAANSTLAPIPVAKRRYVRHRRRVYRSSGRKIACTPAGCHPIPPGCTPTPGFDFWGNPTGYDDIVCR